MRVTVLKHPVINNRPGGNAHHLAPILHCAIPPGHYGRSLTLAEQSRLRAMGWHPSPDYSVVRLDPASPHVGKVRRRAPGGGREDAHIYVCLSKEPPGAQPARRRR
jgi:hypothetical protein